LAIPTKRFIIGGIDYSVLKSFVFSDVFDKLKFDDNDNLYVVIGADDVGLAKDSTVSVISTTVSDIDSKISPIKFDSNGNLYVVIGADDVGLAKDSSLQDIYNKLSSGIPTLVSKVPKQLASSTTVNANSSATYTVNPNDRSALVVTAKVTYNSSATSGATINVYCSPDGTNYDTEPFDSQTLSFSAGATVQQTFIFAAPTQYMKIEVKNNDSTYGLTLDLWATTF